MTVCRPPPVLNTTEAEGYWLRQELFALTYADGAYMILAIFILTSFKIYLKLRFKVTTAMFAWCIDRPIVPCYAILCLYCCAVLCHAMLCYAVLCCALPGYPMLCFARGDASTSWSAEWWSDSQTTLATSDRQSCKREPEKHILVLKKRHSMCNFPLNTLGNLWPFDRQRSKRIPLK